MSRARPGPTNETASHSAAALSRRRVSPSIALGALFAMAISACGPSVTADSGASSDASNVRGDAWGGDSAASEVGDAVDPDGALERDTHANDAFAPDDANLTDASADIPPSDVTRADASPPRDAAPALFPESPGGRAASDDFHDAPQYLAFRKSPTELPDEAHRARCVALLPGLAGRPFYGNRGTCVIFNRGILTAIPDVTVRRAVMAQGFLEIPTRVGAATSGDGARRAAVEVFVDLLATDPDTNATYLHDLLTAARTARVPVFVALDAVSWLDWYFDHVPGSRDAVNVEWAGYDAASAVRVGWRNWGSQFRIDLPFPALTSRVYRDAIHRALERLLPIVRAFTDSLGPDEQYLYGGIILGTELSVGVNYYHYPFGNLFLGMDSRCDPGLPYVPGCPRGTGACTAYNRTCPPDFGHGSLSGGVVQLGFRSALDLGALSPGQAMTREVLDRIITDYLGYLHHAVRVEYGLPSHKIFSHTGGTFGGTAGVHTLGIARVGAAVAGWSMYFTGAASPIGELGSYIETPAARSLPWASPEWLPFGPDDTGSNWRAAYEQNLLYRNNRMLSVANWEGVSPNGTAISAARATIQTPAGCLTTPRVLLGTADLPSGTMLHFTRSRGGTASFLNVSTSNALAYGGSLARIDSVNADATGVASFSLEGRAGPLHVQMITDGCVEGGIARRQFSPIVRIDAHAGSGAPPPPPWLFSAASGQHVTLSWEVPPGTAATYLVVTTDPTFTRVDAVNENVSAAQLFVWSAYTPGTRYYARVVVDGAFGRRVSNTLQIAR